MEFIRKILQNPLNNTAHINQKNNSSEVMIFYGLGNEKQTK